MDNLSLVYYYDFSKDVKYKIMAAIQRENVIEELLIIIKEYDIKFKEVNEKIVELENEKRDILLERSF